MISQTTLHELLGSIKIPLLHCTSENHYMFKNIKNMEVIEGIKIPSTRIKITESNRKMEIETSEGDKRILPEKNKIIVYDIDPLFKEEIIGIVPSLNPYRRIYTLSQIKNIKTKYDKNPSILFEKIQRAIDTGNIYNFKINNRYYKGLKDPETGKLIPEFLVPLVKYIITPTRYAEINGTHFLKVLKVIISNGSRKRVMYLKTIEIVDIGNTLKGVHLAEKNIMPLENIKEEYSNAIHIYEDKNEKFTKKIIKPNITKA